VVAEDAVVLHWAEIGELAKELLVRKTMTGRETKAFLQAGTAAERLAVEQVGLGDQPEGDRGQNVGVTP
jgi:hypothetical protein